jgi:hypothetical protein
MGNQTDGPAWLKAALDQRVAKLKDMLPWGVAKAMGMDVILLGLTEPAEDATDEERKVWDETCDNCGKHVPGQLYSGRGAYLTGDDETTVTIVVTFGCCATCKEAP